LAKPAFADCEQLDTQLRDINRIALWRAANARINGFPLRKRSGGPFWQTSGIFPPISGGN
jgi:hypothetical protein